MGVLRPCTHTKEEYSLYDSLDKGTRHPCGRALPSQDPQHPHPIPLQLPKVGNNHRLVIVCGLEDEDKLLENSNVTQGLAIGIKGGISSGPSRFRGYPVPLPFHPPGAQIFDSIYAIKSVP